VRRPAAIALLLVATAFWGVTFAVVKEAVARVDVFVFLTQRFAASFLVLAAIAVWRRGAPEAAALRRGAWMGVFLFLAFATQTAALRLASASSVGFLTGLGIVLVPLLAALLFRQRVGASLWAAVALAVCGLFLLTAAGRWAPPGAGDALALACALAVALQMLLTDRYAPGNDVVWLTTAQIGVVALGSWAVAAAAGRPVWVWHPFLLKPLLFLVLCATVFGFLVQTAAQRVLSPTHAALVVCLEPVFAAAWAHHALGERLGAAGWAGAALILAGMVTAELGAARECALPRCR
jgi:drug/metabolite transporter (DMT)-like permease